jgi:hypothetical protein
MSGSSNLQYLPHFVEARAADEVRDFQGRTSLSHSGSDWHGAQRVLAERGRRSSRIFCRIFCGDATVKHDSLTGRTRALATTAQK